LDRLGQFLVTKGLDVAAMHDLNQVVQLVTERLCGQFNLPSWACRALLGARGRRARADYLIMTSIDHLSRVPRPSRLAATVDRMILWLGKVRLCEIIVSSGSASLAMPGDRGRWPSRGLRLHPPGGRPTKSSPETHDIPDETVLSARTGSRRVAASRAVAVTP
jgi:hypothetical protein